MSFRQPVFPKEYIPLDEPLAKWFEDTISNSYTSLYEDINNYCQIVWVKDCLYKYWFLYSSNTFVPSSFQEKNQKIIQNYLDEMSPLTKENYKDFYINKVLTKQEAYKLTSPEFFNKRTDMFVDFKDRKINNYYFSDINQTDDSIKYYSDIFTILYCNKLKLLDVKYEDVCWNKKDWKGLFLIENLFKIKLYYLLLSFRKYGRTSKILRRIRPN